MIKIHCLAYSRATRLIWLMEDMGQPYDLVQYDRTDQFHAPDALKKVHPLGKSPVLEDGDLILAESATCLRYLVDKFGDKTHRPQGAPDDIRHEELLDYVEGSFAGVCMDVMIPILKGDEPSDAARGKLRKHLNYIDQHLPRTGLIFGETACLADIQFSYLLANLDGNGFLDSHPPIKMYWGDLQEQPGFKAATSIAGPMAPDL